MALSLPNMQEQIELAPYTTFKIGGPAQYFAVVNTRAELKEALAQARANDIDWFLLGGGSDVLISDDGFKGLAIKLELNAIEFDENLMQVRAEAGVKMGKLITECMQRELTGLEFAIGVPATVGGAVWANLGARGHEIKDVLIEAAAITQNGEERVLSVNDCQFSYRNSIFKKEPHVIVDALFQLQKGNQDEIRVATKELASMRTETQDIGALSAGCAFANPVGQTDKSAGQLIDELDLKGKQMGGAKVSEKHANFIVNTGNATAKDVVMLISYVKQQVRDKKGVQLQEEIEYIGF
ncbi:MAG: UDP-N-acetylmuramate dehydrogenase [Candidatus Kerfeldbacteria bacterium]